MARQMVNQRLQFPRNIDLDPAGDAIVPQNVKDAQCEQAVYLLSFDESIMAAQMQGIQEETITAGPVRIRQKFAGGATSGIALSPMALDLMREFLRPTRKMQRS
jgi:hypothetical protein